MFTYVNGKAYYSELMIMIILSDDPDTLAECEFDRHPSLVRDGDGRSLLHMSVDFGSKRLVEVCLNFGCEINGQDCDGETPLMYAMRARTRLEELANSDQFEELALDNFEIVKLLLDHGADLRIKNNRGAGPLTYLEQSPRYCFIQLLMQSMASQKLCTEEMTSMFVEADVPLFIVALTRNIDLLRNACEARGNVISYEMDGMAALMSAISTDDMHMIQCLIDNGANIGCKLSNNLNLLHWAAAKTVTDSNAQYYEDIVGFLLEKGIDVNASCTNEKTPVHLVAKRGTKRAMLLCLKHGANVSARDTDKNSVLHYAAKNPDGRVLQLLLSGKFDGLDVDTRNTKDQTPLHIASREMSLVNIKNLLCHGADINANDSSGRTPLNLFLESAKIAVELKSQSMKQKESEILSLMLRYGADVNMAGSSGESVLSLTENVDFLMPLLRHLAKLDLLGGQISRKNIEFIDGNSDLSEYYEMCRAEFAKMRSKKVYGRVSFYNLMFDDVDTLARYARNQKIMNAIHPSRICKHFPIFCKKIKKNVKNAIKRHKLLVSAEEKLQHNVLFTNPDITDCILRYLSIVDLKNVCSMK